MNELLFSVIVPVYNVEKYIDQCLSSIQKQTYKDFEVIIVNDGSKDESINIAKKYVEADSRFSIIDQENKGLAIARRVGALSAKGQYIINIDSDDYVDEKYFENMAEIIKSNNSPDLVCLNHFENEDKLIENPNFNDTLLNKEQIEKIIYPYLIRAKDFHYFVPTAWSKAIKRELYTKFTCTTRIQVGEDGSVTIPVVINSNTIYLSKKTGYHYRINNSSLIQNKKPRNYDDVFNTYNHIISNIDINEFDFKKQLYRFISHLFFNCSVTQFYCDKKYKEVKKIILEKMNEPIIKEAIKHLDASGFKGKLMRHSLKHKRIYLMKLYSHIM
ncbi:MAG: glycosyltransferase family 2 protein [Bacilli bacterium]|nr:glycosyltransferase family 2 protein [Bacilli bacterium]